MSEWLFDVLDDQWELITLGEACQLSGGNIQTGPFGSQLHASDYVPIGIPSIMPQNLSTDRISTNEISYIRVEDAERLSRYRVQIGDIVYSRRGDVERRALVTENENGWLCGTGCLRIRFGVGTVDPVYAYYYLGHPSVREWIVRHAIGATLPNLNTSILYALPFVLPPLSEQRAIADILGSLDDKIELNRRMNATLEESARALFKSWFVDFDPVRAKMDGRQPDGMDAETAALFPDRLVESELGPIPEGWEIRPLDKVANFLNGLALQKFSPEGEDYLPVIKIRELRQGHSDYSSDRASPAINPEYIIYDGDIVFSWSGSLLVDIWTGGTGALNQHLFKVSSEQYPKWFYYLWVVYHLEEFQQIAADKATTMGHIQRYHLSAALTIVPPDEVLHDMDAILYPILDGLIINRLQSRTLAETRDTLLPKLLSGEVQNVEEIYP